MPRDDGICASFNRRKKTRFPTGNRRYTDDIILHRAGHTHITHIKMPLTQSRVRAAMNG